MFECAAQPGMNGQAATRASSALLLIGLELSFSGSPPYPRGLPHGTAPGAEPLTAADEGGGAGGAAAVAGGVKDLIQLRNGPESGHGGIHMRLLNLIIGQRQPISCVRRF